jgi:predicted nucleic acid-binding protein
MRAGLSALDAAHVACAEAAACEYLLTCDDQVVRKARRLHLTIQVQNPITYLEEQADV